MPYRMFVGERIVVLRRRKRSRLRACVRAGKCAEGAERKPLSNTSHRMHKTRRFAGIDRRRSRPHDFSRWRKVKRRAGGRALLAHSGRF